MPAKAPSSRRPGRQRRRAPVPRYRRIADELIGDIRAGRWQPGDTLPGDIELTQRFGVGRHTVRAALQQLEGLGLISRRPRVGTVLLATTPRSAYTHSVQATDGLLQYPPDSPLRVESSDAVTVGRQLASALRLPLGSDWHHLGGVRASPDAGPPLCWVDVYLLPELAPVVERLGDGSRRIFELIEEMSGRRVARVTIDLQAAALPSRLAHALEVPGGSPALAITRRFYDDDGVLFEVSHSQHPAGRFGYELELVRDWQRATPG